MATARSRRRSRCCRRWRGWTSRRPAFHALRPAGGGGDPGRAVRGAAARHRADRRRFRAGDGGVVRRHRAARHRRHRAASRRCCWRSIRATGWPSLFSGGVTGFLVLGGVFLCVTGAEALYADMGHFGARPIRLAWSAVVLPALVLNYAGQAALVLAGAPTADNIFYRLCAGAAAGAAGAARDGRDHHRQPVDHHRRVLDDAAGDPARLAAAPADHADLGRGLRADLCRRR